MVIGLLGQLQSLTLNVGAPRRRCLPLQPVAVGLIALARVVNGLAGQHLPALLHHIALVSVGEHRRYAFVERLQRRRRGLITTGLGQVVAQPGDVVGAKRFRLAYSISVIIIGLEGDDVLGPEIRLSQGLALTRFDVLHPLGVMIRDVLRHPVHNRDVFTGRVVIDQPHRLRIHRGDPLDQLEGVGLGVVAERHRTVGHLVGVVHGAQLGQTPGGIALRRRRIAGLAPLHRREQRFGMLVF